MRTVKRLVIIFFVLIVCVGCDQSTKLFAESRLPKTQALSFLSDTVRLAGIASAGGVVAMDLIAIDKIRTGQGLDTFRSRWLVEDNWIGFLVFVVATTVVTLLAPVMGWLLRRKERREIQQFQSKYSEEHHGEQVD